MSSKINALIQNSKEVIELVIRDRDLQNRPGYPLPDWPNWSYTEIEGEPIKIGNLPSYGIYWRDLQQGDNYHARRFNRGTLSFTFFVEKIQGHERAWSYWGEVRDLLINGLMKTYRSKLGILRCQPSSSATQPNTDLDYLSYRQDFEVLIA